ncbi:MAG: ABC transporter substrate-binding protein [Lautropia sp.]|nr:MAG: ABC transporter substrate-binding protein [Pseudomonadota bacterium]MBC6958136.1 ABC transporter substrate-binding protein [Lautropia sp.]MCL4700287.1 ABC transporter substrate-binding protein [Burkholderiaceae bacterium]MCZ2413162.1 ABC transporter substrate-binding protein [Burkholderiales bacterium]MDL1906835.1 ABC transporter substrate-binding protein [Betaproteobacteria bacterium PRO1]
MYWRLMTLGAALALVAGSVAGQTQGVSKTEIVVGSLQDLSGPIASLGKASRNGMQMRIDEQNEKGGVHGRKIRFLVEDHAYDPKRAVLATHKLLEQDKIFLMLGHIGTPTNVAVMPLLFERNVINLFPFSPARQMFDPVHRLKFASFTPYHDQVRQSVPVLVRQKGLKKPCIIYQDDDYGIEHLKGAEEGLKTINLQWIEKTSYKRGATDFSSQVARMKSAGCDLVVLGTLVRETIGTVSEARKTGFSPVFLGTTGLYYDQIHKLGGPAMEGIIATHTAAVPYPDSGSEAVRAWIQRYKSKFGEDPWMHSVYGYANAEAMITALEKAGPDLTTDSLISAIEATRFPTDIFGSAEMTFSPTKRLGSSLYRFAEIRNGRWVTTSDYFGER